MTLNRQNLGEQRFFKFLSCCFFNINYYILTEQDISDGNSDRFFRYFDLKHENFAASVKIWKSMIYPLLITVNELKLKGWIRAG